MGEIQETSGSLTLSQVSGLFEDVDPALEKAAATFKVTINGPSWPLKAYLVHSGGILNILLNRKKV